ncbi:SDR family NAD(P)-dependent oxidoreductase [Aquincola tertiaricarbonis]|uniref:SDR family NAD(P)-dependent oxidoreductase n=1 Tax=Aquincola tertiaricarbonis TaxID=391953 RepID=UPI000614E1D1|nr:SDR family oxidoreductase [Aquincola tertiaricarbonis]
MQQSSSFKGRVALVTGGASGIGLACAQRLRAAGAKVVIADLDAAGAAEAATRIDAMGVGLDVVDRGAVADLRRQLEAHGVLVDCLVNCAGIVQDPLAPDALPHGVWRRVLAVDLEGTYACCAEFGSAMARRGGGAIVNIASVAGMRSMPLHAYSPAKAGVISLGESLAAEWGRSGVRVNTVSPGYTVTAALQGQIDKGLRDPEKLKANSALGVLIRPEHIAAAIVFLLSDDAQMVTGVNLPVDAGWLVAGSWSTFGGVRPAITDLDTTPPETTA